MGYKYISCNTQHVSGETYCSLTESQSESYAEESTMQHTQALQADFHAKVRAFLVNKIIYVNEMLIVC